MMKQAVVALALLAGLALAPAAQAQKVPEMDAATKARLTEVLASDHRSPENKWRDRYRHPAETLAFFGLRQDMSVVEIWPGGGWYTEVLAPLMKGKGKYIAAGFDPDGGEGMKQGVAAFDRKLKARPDLYSETVVTALSQQKNEIAPAGSVDMVLTFRNAHNWLVMGFEDAAFASFYKALKPGGVLGVVDHRIAKAKEDPKFANGYVSEEKIIQIAEKAGFKLVAKSEVNANPKDTRDHPGGVWTLPPNLRQGDKDRDKYTAIGESDRMTLKFVKPAA